jgi:mannose-6-phosphate isomerase class I
LHIEQGLECIDFNDITPTLIESKGEVILKDQLFEVQKWQLSEPRNVAPPGQFAIICCLTGCVRCAAVDLRPGEFFLVPASLQDGQLQSKADGTTLLRITIPV